ncbi:MAG: YhbY family RNA-binding protein [Burkholderiaceae bacterium]|nr:YhbY family RNA-binding protein [Burkholderiaceae bacterium]
MLNLTPAERSDLRSQAHGLNPVVMIGESGLTPAVVKEADAALNAHGLIKIRVFGDDREARLAYYDTLCSELGAAPVQHIGKLLVLYRPKQDKPKEPKTSRGKGLREVVLVKTHPTKRPTVTKVMVKGNERVTAGGNIRRAKTRQKSLKKSALGK